MNFLNLGILAHVDAGKTSLTERLLFNAGIIDRVGSVDQGSTQTDSMELERRRGITIQSAVVAFALGDLTVNLIDTPGHTDFIAEVERALHVLDGAVLVVSAVEGVQAQTRVLMRTLKRLGVPTLVFVNKIDRRGAREDDLLREMAEHLTPAILPMTTVVGIGGIEAQVAPVSFDQPERFDQAIERLTAGNDDFLAAYLDASDPRGLDWQSELTAQTRRGAAHPVYFGSAVTGAGVEALTAGIRRFLPAPAREADGPPQGTVFKVEHSETGRKTAYIRLRAGTLVPRERLEVFRRSPEGTVSLDAGKVTGVEVFASGAGTTTGSAPPGSIAKASGLTDVRIGDAVGSAAELADRGLFTPPTLETVVRAVDRNDKIALAKALTSLAERDPLVDPHLDEVSGQTAVRLYGEVQKEVVASLLAEEFGIAVRFEQTRAIHIERPNQAAEALHEMGRWAPTSHALTLGLRIEPAEPGSGLVYELEVERGSLTRAMRNAVEEAVRTRLRRGPHGWEITDCRVAVTATGYLGPVKPGQFREVAVLLLDGMIEEAGTTVYAPVNRFELEFPHRSSGAVVAALIDCRAMINGQFSANGVGYIRGAMDAESVNGFESRLPSLTRGRSVFLAELDHYRPIRTNPPRRS
ncbi:GTP-binding protein [Glycomyces buryatensis]|uniref:GTP-binding protein n=1 Tax=Glycomyces buryatensis TaxID=2570927 RepID=A0A4S8PSY7_9ACTN|nr:GTP-binding protein [Glycomyces buryatensis]THV32905.1 GTP-binding protein [Glycomyces buryatensis]